MGDLMSKCHDMWKEEQAAARTTRGDEMESPAVPGPYVTGGLPTLDDGEWAEKSCPPLAQAGQVSSLYAGLHGVLSDAYHQAAGGKGKERHATDDPFEDQPIMVITRLLADHPVAALGYQAVKKTVEAGRLHRTKGPDAAIRELHGAINYLAAMVIRVREMGDIRDSRTQDGARG